MSDNTQYFAARAIQERRLAMASADQKVRAVHLELAARYVQLATEDQVHELEEEQRA